MANQEYITSSKSLRYNKNRKAIVGIEEYNEGKADKISGLEVIDDSTMKNTPKRSNSFYILGRKLCRRIN